MSDMENSEVLEDGSPSREDQNQEKSLEVEELFHTFFSSPRHINNDEAYFQGIHQFSVTSGDLAAKVQLRHDREDASISKMDQKPDPQISDQCSSLSLLELDDSIGNQKSIENGLIEFYHDFDLGKIWRRRLLAFVGQ